MNSMLKERCSVQKKTSVLGPGGEAVSWSKVGDYWCRKIPVSTQTRNAFMQNGTVVTDKFIFGGSVDLGLGSHRIIYMGRTYEIASSAQHAGGNTVVITNGS